MNTKTKTQLYCLAAYLSMVAITVWLCAWTLQRAHNYTNQATHPHAIKTAHKP